jgi:hypothetical protein
MNKPKRELTDKERRQKEKDEDERLRILEMYEFTLLFDYA